ncbi:secreted antigen 1 [Babesia divergens]|uniref:Secreted antigen 1 n=1 Tax=Babesia divergens TaxID=32595 RepID=A0AAD9GC01_BABDI|nr:secreted antigen 1 [Babesia divergens]
MTEAKVEPCNFEFKQGSLKDILEELGKLYTTTGTRHKVFQQLRTYLKAYCGDTYLDAFYKDYGSSMFGGTILLLTDAGKKISEAILQKPSWTSRWEDPHAKHPQCIQKYAEALKKCLPELFSALYYLYFNVSKECKEIKGGKWNNVKVNQNHEKLGEWLTEDHDMTDLITRGYKLGELNTSNTGQNVADPLKKAVSLTLGSDYGSLQNVLCGLMFVCKWDDALTGHALCFLYTFCEKVMEYQVGGDLQGKLKGQSKVQVDALYSLCVHLQIHLQPFTNESDFCLTAVCHGNTNLFKDLWDDGKFDKYCDWLKRNLDKIIASLKNISLKYSPWSAQTLQACVTAGPFKYGFVFTDSWDGNWESVKGNVKEHVSNLTNGDKGSLDELRKCLNGESLSYAYQSSHHSQTQPEGNSNNSGAAAAGGATAVLGIGGAGFGAAYGFNLFGLKDIMSGVFGAIRGLVVGF